MKHIIFYLAMAGSVVWAQTAPAPSVTYQIVSNWGSGLTANVTITNPGSKPINNWTLQLTYANSIASIWDAQIQSHTGNQYTIGSVGYNATIPAGGSVTFGWNANGAAQGPSGCVLNSVSAASSSCPALTETNGGSSSAPSNVSYSVTQNWGTAFQAQFTIINPSQTAVSNWSVQINYPYTINSIWDATIVSHIGNLYVINGGGWNNNIPADGSVSFGVVVSGSSTGGPTVCAVNSVPTGATSCPGAASAWPAQVFAPYVDMTAWPTPNLTSAYSTTHQKYFTLAFVVSQGSCHASWGGILPLNSFASDIASLKAAGGDIIVSFGGAAGTDLAQSCTSASSLQAQYQQVIDTLGATRIDFDVEGAALTDQTSITRRNQAIAALQTAAQNGGKSLTVQFTLPALPTGLTADGLTLLQNAKHAGVKFSTVNLMAMDYGSSFDGSRMGAYAMQAAKAASAQLSSILGSGVTDADRWRMIGVTPMIGLNDVAGETFTLMDAADLVNWAASQKIGFLSQWSLARDKACSGNLTYVSPDCSGVAQSPFAFTNQFRIFTK